jgi:predicted PurR-regulated permease PerM
MRYDIPMKEEKNFHVSITAGTVVKAILILIGVWTLWILRDLALVVVTAVVVASAIEPGIKFLSRFKINRILGVLLIYLSSASLLLGLVYGFVPPIVNEAADVSQKLPTMLHTIDQSLFGANGVLVPLLSQNGQGTAAGMSPIFEQLFNKVSGAGAAASQNALDQVSMVFSGLFSFVLIVILSFYFAMQEHGIQNFLRIVIPGRETEAYAIDLWERSKEKIGKWMQGQLLLGVLMFVLVYLGLTIFGVPYALSLALLAGTFEIIPVFGPILSAIPGVILAFTAGGTTLALIIAAFYLLVQQFESHLIYPLVVRKIVGVPPILVILALIIGWELAGVLGVLISVPVASILMEVVDDIEKKKEILA